MTMNAQAQRYVISDASQIKLSGTSTVNSFECEAETLEFDYRVRHQIEGNGFSVPGVSLVVPVHGLDCANRRMNRDLQDALQADQFPDVRLDVFRINLVPEARADAEKKDTPQVELVGRMTLAGVSRDVTIRLSGWLDERLRLHGLGSLEVKMTDFGVEPPTALLGLVKAHDDITIHFHLMADPQPAGTSAAAGALVLPATPRRTGAASDL
jgi:polyisoprenoid-binding protein YceI